MNAGDQVWADRIRRSQSNIEPPFAAGPVIAGTAVIAGVIGAFALWSFLAPLESAVVAAGVVEVSSSRKTVQHLEGGIVEQVLVEEGARVRAGDVLLRLRDTARVAQRNQVRAQYVEARATEIRLAAERDGADRIKWPQDLEAGSANVESSGILAGQETIFRSRKNLLAERIGVIERRVAALRQEIEGQNGKIGALRKQGAIVDDELRGVTDLYAKNLVPKPRLLALEARKAEVEGAIAELRAQIERTGEGVAEAKLQIAEVKAAAYTDAVEQLRAASARVYELAQQLTAAEDGVRRTEIVSPSNGVVVGLKARTVGGVIAGGETVLEVVPVGDELVVNASIVPEDVDQVKPGLPAQVRLTALNRRNSRLLRGEVVTVSADRMLDPQTGLPYYLARIELRGDGGATGPAALQPGMGAEVMIRTGARTAVEYLVAPISRSFDRALRED